MGRVSLLLFVFVSLVGCATNDQARVDPGYQTTVSNAKVSCGVNSYVNDAGECVSEPLLSSEVPPEATAKCKAQVNGKHWYSFSQTRRGTCSQFGGVLQWCNLGKCIDK